MIPAYDLRDSPEGNFGIHNAELNFYVSRGRCAVLWEFSTDWHLKGIKRGTEPGLGSIAEHSPVPFYEGQEIAHESCGFTGGPCYCSATYVGSGELFEKAVKDPSVIWETLERKLKAIEEMVKVEMEDRRNFS